MSPVSVSQAESSVTLGQGKPSTLPRVEEPAEGSSSSSSDDNSSSSSSSMAVCDEDEFSARSKRKEELSLDQIEIKMNIMEDEATKSPTTKKRKQFRNTVSPSLQKKSR